MNYDFIPPECTDPYCYPECADDCFWCADRIDEEDELRNGKTSKTQATNRAIQ